MKTETEFQHNGVSVKLVQDTDASSPTEFADTELFLVSGHRDFYVTEPGEKRVRDWEAIRETYKDSHWMFPVEAYIHSGVRLALSRCGNFPDRQWDVSQVGAIFASKKEWRLSKSALKAAESLLGEWNKYLCGDVWGYIVGEDTPFEESCWGFYGLEYAQDEARQAADGVAERLAEESAEANRAACADIVTV